MKTPNIVKAAVTAAAATAAVQMACQAAGSSRDPLVLGGSSSSY
jgi:hypothetical protein